MCVAKENPSESAWRDMFKKPLRPKLPRHIVKSAKVNLNRYWHKFEEMLTVENIHQQRDAKEHLNNKQRSTLKDGFSALELTHLMAKTFTIEKNLNRSGRYRTYRDDSLYHGVNLNNNEAAEEEENQQNEFLELLQHPIYSINFNFN
ncbi:uncharacterized protein LOC129794770 [Lutzomyia longipalpis]|uniref:uncharacterized protein LOC129794770 n=1 Tax=Lutzomyia longipalpis TaxID=7200 RepID=UPI0024837BBF|nr:uncharacterized protein LOC129794770 [Lutzomyia longipalpis]